MAMIRQTVISMSAKAKQSEITVKNYKGRKRTMSSFRKHICNCTHINKTLVSPGKNLKYQIFSHLFQSFRAGKRMSFFSSLYYKMQNIMQRNTGCRGSMAVEAAIAVPFFLFFIMNILFSFDMLRLHGNIMAAMHQTGNKMAFYAYGYKNLSGEDALLTEETDSLILSEGYARAKVIHILGHDYLNNTCLVNGTNGLHFPKSSVMGENDIIELTASYKIRPFIRVIDFPDFHMENRYYGRAWTGYDAEHKQSGIEGEDPIVYVAETGAVYHTARNCTYLNPAVEAASAAAVDSMRNDNGEKYYACDRCERSDFQAVVYVTSNGSRIHGSLSCSGLKRTVYTIHLSEAGDRDKCSKCGTY